MFIQNGMLQPWLDSKALGQATQLLVYFAVAKLGDPPTDGKTEVNPEGLTAAYGPHAEVRRGGGFLVRVEEGTLGGLLLRVGLVCVVFVACLRAGRVSAPARVLCFSHAGHVLGAEGRRLIGRTLAPLPDGSQFNPVLCYLTPLPHPLQNDPPARPSPRACTRGA